MLRFACKVLSKSTAYKSSFVSQNLWLFYVHSKILSILLISNLFSFFFATICKFARLSGWDFLRYVGCKLFQEYGKKAVCGKLNCDYKSGIVVGMTNFYLRTFFESRVFVYKNSKCLLANTIMLNLVQHLTMFSRIPNRVRNDTV